MSIVQNFQSSRNFSCLSLPNLQDIPESFICSLFDTKPRKKEKTDPGCKIMNPITYTKIENGIKLFWAYKSYINQISIVKKRNRIKSSKKLSLKLDSTIISLSVSKTPSRSNQYLLIQTYKSFYTLSQSLCILSSNHTQVSSIKFNPYIPDQITYLKDEKLRTQGPGASSQVLSCSSFKNFEFDFSPYVLTLYNSSSVCTVDTRESKLHQVYSSSNISQILPIDCCYSYSLLNDNIELIDCRYWKAYRKFSHLACSSNWTMFTVPDRSKMYKSGALCKSEQSLFCISDIIEKFDHSFNDIIKEIALNLVPETYESPVVQPSISAFAKLYSALPCKINKNLFWVQVCSAGGVYLENSSNELYLSDLAQSCKISSKSRVKTCKKHDKSGLLSSLLNAKLEFPFSEKPSLPYSLQPIIYDFDD